MSCRAHSNRKGIWVSLSTGFDVLKDVPLGIVSRCLDPLPQGEAVFVGAEDASAIGEPGDVLARVFQRCGPLTAIRHAQMVASPQVVPPPRHPILCRNARG